MGYQNGSGLSEDDGGSPVRPVKPKRVSASQRGRLFTHDPVPYEPLTCVDDPNGRYYILPDGQTKFYSMTTMLGKTSDKTWLEEWRARVGEEFAEKESKRCADRGEAVHLSCEHYIDNEPMPKVMGVCSEYPQLFFQIKRVIDRKVGIVLAQEIPLYSHRMQVAGRVDLVCMYFIKGAWRLCIVDFKTSNFTKTSTMVEDYECQLAGYAVCLYEMTGLRAEYLVNIIADESQPNATEIPFTLDTALPKLKQRVSQFHKLLSNRD